MAFGAVYVNSSADTTNDAALDYTLAADIPAGAGIVVVVQQGTTRDVASGGVTDDAFNTYVKRIGVAGDTAGCEIWDCLDNAALTATQKITVTLTSTERTKAFSVYTLGTTAGNPATYVDGALTNGSTSTPSVSLTLASSCAVIGALSCSGSGGTFTADPDFTNDVSRLANGSALQNSVHANGVSGAVTYNPSLTSATTWRAGLVAYSGSAGGGSDVTGSLAATETGTDTASFTGSVASSGSLSATETGSDTAAFSGSVNTSGSLAATEAGSDTASFSGSVASSGSLAATETGSDTAAFTGSVSAAGVAGVLAATEAGNDTASFSGSVTAPDVTGSLAANETGQDTASFTVSVAPIGVLAAVESGSDTASFTGSTEGGEVRDLRKEGDAWSGSQFKAKRSKRDEDPRSSVQRLVDRFRAAQAKSEDPAPEPIQAPEPVKDEPEPPVTVAEPDPPEPEPIADVPDIAPQEVAAADDPDEDDEEEEELILALLSA